MLLILKKVSDTHYLCSILYIGGFITTDIRNIMNDPKILERIAKAVKSVSMIDVIMYFLFMVVLLHRWTGGPSQVNGPLYWIKIFSIKWWVKQKGLQAQKSKFDAVSIAALILKSIPKIGLWLQWLNYLSSSVNTIFPLCEIGEIRYALHESWIIWVSINKFW